MKDKQMKFFKKPIFVVLFLSSSFYLLASNAYAISDPATIQDLEEVFSRILSLAIPFGGIAAFIMFVIGGFKYLTSGGDPRKSEAARQTITYALVGLLLLVSAFLIINFISTFTGVDVTKFTIKIP